MGSESSTDSRDEALAVLKKADSEFEMNLLASTLAHEIRNPLQSIRLQLDMAARKGSFKEAFQSILTDINRLEAVVSRVQQLGQRHMLHAETVNMKSLIESSLSSLGFWLSATGIFVRTHSSWEGEPLIEGDKELLQQVLLNLFMNAVQAMPNGGHLSIYISEEIEHAVIEVTDSGSGFTAETLKVIGTPFFTTKADGHGLGLSFCKSIAALHGGSMDFENASKGGAKITLRLAKQVKSKEGDNHVQ